MHKGKWLPVLGWALMAASLPGPASVPGVDAADPFEEINKRFQERKSQGDDALLALQNQYQAKRAAMEAQWVKREQEIEARWQQQKREIEKKWDQAQRSTKKEWVDYSPTYDTRSIVNFEEGTVEVTALIPVPPKEKPEARSKAVLVAEAQEEVARQFERVLAEQTGGKKAVLSDQVQGRGGRPVDRQTAKAFVQQEVLPTMVVGDRPVESRDGITRVQVTAKVKMTPDHLKKRAQQYLDTVMEQSRRYQLDPRLVLAVVHTESYFNPKAQSHIPAYGLMQLVPRAAARDSYNFIYKDDRVLDDDYLFVPPQNVELGAAYLYLLKNQIFSDLQEGAKKTYVIVCAYNWGPGNIRKKILKLFRIQDMTDDQVFTLLTDKTPEETRNYLKRVTERMGLYDELVGR
jgi:membrane-bound lytic murein transglycosylase C